MIHKDNLDKIPKEAGIYYLYSKKRKLVYIGKADNLKNRITKHYNNHKEALIYYSKKSYYFPTLHLTKPFEYYRYTIIKDKLTRKNVEKELIKELKPKYNNINVMQSRYDKHFNYNFFLDKL